MEKFKLLLQLMSKGSEVSDVEKWKAHQITAAQITVVVGILVALAKAFGYSIPLSLDEQGALGIVVYALVNWVLTAVTSKRAGFEPKVQPERTPDSDKGNDDLYRG